MNDRRKKGAFKKGIDAEDARRKREVNIVELRKNKRDENLQKKRAVFAAPGAAAMEDTNRGTAAFQRKVWTLLSAMVFPFSFPDLELS